MRSRAISLPTPSTCPCTMWPPNRPSAFMGSSRFTNAPCFIRESEVLAHVSGARSAENDLTFISRAVRHTPLTAMLSPVCSSLGACFASTVMWRFSPRCSMRAMRPTSSMMPVNMGSSEDVSDEDSIWHLAPSICQLLSAKCSRTDPANIPLPRNPPRNDAA